uniref:Uncharacterized protein n=1 Tax=Anopheles coluzzii TaxID=1518534 RepID=A0A8W7PN02_ANOCL
MMKPNTAESRNSLRSCAIRACIRILDPVRVGEEVALIALQRRSLRIFILIIVLRILRHRAEMVILRPRRRSALARMMSVRVDVLFQILNLLRNGVQRIGNSKQRNRPAIEMSIEPSSSDPFPTPPCRKPSSDFCFARLAASSASFFSCSISFFVFFATTSRVPHETTFRLMME